MQPIDPDAPFRPSDLAAAYEDARRHRQPVYSRPDPSTAWGEHVLDAFAQLQPQVDAGLQWLATDLTTRIAREMSPFASLLETTRAVADLYQDHRAQLDDAEVEYKESLRALLDEALAMHFVPISPFDEPDEIRVPVEISWRQIEEISGVTQGQAKPFPPGLW
ncbi:hypothetical protein [Nocardioides yefusunii]|uniref:Uncharacterized protein n=1 Tax=Nocardioides yefusunii TaxID=2500546 RepID=A0ABW1R250_9ACTN|nr:hypothetical protein [Nocardioides yefusunii]